MEATQSLEQRLRRENGSVSLFVATLGCVAVLVYFSADSNLIVASYLNQTGILDTSRILTSSFLGILILFPLAYCSVVSLLKSPKRIVSPVNVQVTTFAVNSILIVYLYMSLRYYTHGYYAGQFAFNLISLAIPAFVFQISLGAIQTLFVSWFVGLNIGELNATMYIVKLPFATVRRVLLQESFTDTWDFKTEFDKHGILVLTKNNLIVVARKDNHRTVLSYLAYRKGTYAIESENENVAESMLNDLRCRLPRGSVVRKARRITPLLNATAGIAYRYATRSGRSKAATAQETWNHLPNYMRFAFPATIIGYVVVATIYALQTQLHVTIDTGVFLETSGVFFLGFVVELGVAGWQALAERRTRDRSPMNS